MFMCPGLLHYVRPYNCQQINTKFIRQADAWYKTTMNSIHALLFTFFLCVHACVSRVDKDTQIVIQVILFNSWPCEYWQTLNLIKGYPLEYCGKWLQP